MLKTFCIDQSQINSHNSTAFFGAVLDYLVTEKISDRFEIEDLRKSLESEDLLSEKRSRFPVRIIRKKDKFHFQGPFDGEAADKFKEIWQKQKKYRAHLCPFMHLRILAGQEEVFGSFDYGSVIVLDFNDTQAEKFFKEYLVKAGLSDRLLKKTK